MESLQDFIRRTKNLWNVFDLEMRVLPVILAMKQKGVRVDLRVETLKTQLVKREKDIPTDKERISVFEIQLWAANSLQKCLMQMKLTYLRTPTGMPIYKSVPRESLSPHS